MLLALPLVPLFPDAVLRDGSVTPMWLPVVPWLLALPAFGPGEPPVPFTMPFPDIDPAAVPLELVAPAALGPVLAALPVAPPPAACASSDEPESASEATSASTAGFMVRPFD